MHRIKLKFSRSAVEYYFGAAFSTLGKLAHKKSSVIITDENVFRAHKDKFKGWNVIALKAGEEYKVQATADAVIETLIGLKADRKTTLIGIGGGVITDLTGYVASIFMRGIDFGFVPTTLLAMVDASIGGKNGIDVGEYKNMVGTINQPRFLLYDYSFLETLSDSVWSDGFAEIIKHACIKDSSAFRLLESNDLDSVRNNKKLISFIVERNAKLKSKVVQIDEFEKADRKLLNFGHTLGHAIETQYELTHGQAISIGMGYACKISELLRDFRQTDRVKAVLTQYGLPVDASFKMDKVFRILSMDKKRVSKEMNYVVLDKIGRGAIHPLPVKELELLLKRIHSEA